MSLSVRAYATHRGVSHVAVLKAIKAGRITRGADGKIDPDQADAEWAARTDPAHPRAKAKRKKKANGEPTPVVAQPADPFGPTFVQARTMHEVAKAQERRLRVQRLQDELVDRRRAVALVFRLARQEREAWKNWAAREAPRMAAELGVDAAKMQTILEAYVRKHLSSLTEITPNLQG